MRISADGGCIDSPSPRNEATMWQFMAGRGVPVFLQTEAAECGLACIAMVAAYHGYGCDLVSLRQRFGVSSRGLNLSDISQISGHLHLATRSIRIELEDLRLLKLPAMLHWELNHFVLLVKVSKLHVVIHDPACGKRKFRITELSQRFTGVAMELTPTAEFTLVDNRRVIKFSHLFSRITGLTRSLGGIFILSLLLQIFLILAPFYIQAVIDYTLSGEDPDLLLILALGFGGLLLLQTATQALREYWVVHLASRLSIQLSANLFYHLIRLPLDYFFKRHIGDIVARSNSITAVQQYITRGLITTIVDGILAFITLGMMYIYSVTLATISVSIVVVSSMLRFVFYRPLRLATEEAIESKAKQDSHFIESIRAIQTIKIFQKESARHSQWQNYLADNINSSVTATKWQTISDLSRTLLSGVENLLSIYFGAMAVMQGALSMGMLFAFLIFRVRFSTSIYSLVTTLIDWKMLDLHMERLSDIVFTPTEQGVYSTMRPLSEATGRRASQDTTIVGKIEAKGLAFQYSAFDEPVFSDLSFTIYPGETVALVGPSGCGKTTLIKCLMGLLVPTEGQILVDDQHLSDLPHYRSQIAAVMQDERLFSGTVADNISCFAPEIDIDLVKTCARQASIHNEIMGMTMQYNTLVNDLGVNLSGGQCQRIILARALYRRARILFLDEATSSLDEVAERVISHHIKQLSITRIIVAHRPETIASVSRSIMLSHLGAS